MQAAVNTARAGRPSKNAKLSTTAAGTANKVSALARSATTNNKPIDIKSHSQQKAACEHVQAEELEETLRVKARAKGDCCQLSQLALMHFVKCMAMLQPPTYHGK